MHLYKIKLILFPQQLYRHSFSSRSKNATNGFSKRQVYVYFFSFYSSSHRRIVQSYLFPANGDEFVTVRVETTIAQEIATAGRRLLRFVNCKNIDRES